MPTQIILNILSHLLFAFVGFFVCCLFTSDKYDDKIQEINNLKIENQQKDIIIDFYKKELIKKESNKNE